RHRRLATAGDDLPVRSHREPARRNADARVLEPAPGKAGKMNPFKSLRVFDEAGKVSARVLEVKLEELSPGAVVIQTAYSSVNYKDALAATGAGKIIRSFPRIAGIDATGTVISSADARFKAGD